MNRTQEYIKLARFNGIVFNDAKLIHRQAGELWPSAANLTSDLSNGQHHFERLGESMNRYQIKIEGKWRDLYAFSASKLSERVRQLTGFVVEEVREFQP